MGLLSCLICTEEETEAQMFKDLTKDAHGEVVGHGCKAGS